MQADHGSVLTDCWADDDAGAGRPSCAAEDPREDGRELSPLVACVATVGSPWNSTSSVWSIQPATACNTASAVRRQVNALAVAIPASLRGRRPSCFSRCTSRR